MIGLMFIFAFLVYLLVCFFVVRGVSRWAKGKGRHPARWGIIAGIFMYLLMFWDHIPTLVLHKYYCETKAGFWVYKTPVQWQEDNPGVAKTLTWQEVSPHYKNMDVVFGRQLNERFVFEVTRKNLPILPIRLTTTTITDTKNRETLVKKVSVGCGYDGFYKFWVSSKTCSYGQKQLNDIQFEFKTLGREIK